MIRVSLIVAAFFAVTIALILVQPSTPRRSADIAAPSTTDVTRSEVNLSGFAAPAQSPVPAAQAEAALKDMVRATPQNGAPSVAPSIAAQPQAAQLQVASARPAALAPSTASMTLEALIVDALRQGQSKDYIHALVNDAAKKGRVEVPKSLITAEGQVDTALLLATLSEYANAAPEIQTYIVSPGDSLASIAYRFYGRTDRQADILNANRETLADADKLSVGQVLTIPNL